MSPLHAGALVLAALGVISVLVGWTLTGRPRAGIPFALELWTGGGLLELAATRHWSAIVTAAAIVLLRKLIAAGLEKI